MNADGSGARVVVPETAWLGKPSWAPDGRRIAFCICDVSDGGIDVVNIDGTGRRRLDRDAHSPAWSPGGRKIAFVEPALDDDEGDVVVMNTDGTDKRVAAGVDDEVAWLDPAWSPDGEKLSFVATDAPDTGSYVVPYLAYTTNWHAEPPRVRLLSHAQAWAADWAPDGHHILFSYNGALRVLDLRTQRTTFLHDGVAGDWSPDGRRIVFADRDGDLHTMSAHGTDVRSLVPR
jgi:Tol biopolymer transport system component